MKTWMVALKIFILFTVVTGILYPLLITGISQLFFYNKANGSLIYKANQVTGSKLIGQKFDSAIWFSSRPSAMFYNPMPSGGSNFGLTNIKLKIQYRDRRKQFIDYNDLESNTVVPSEMLFASASGLDPHISPEAALLQVDRVAKARSFNAVKRETLIRTISELTEEPSFLCLGETRINVLLLNLKLDEIK